MTRLELSKPRKTHTGSNLAALRTGTLRRAKAYFLVNQTTKPILEAAVLTMASWSEPSPRPVRRNLPLALCWVALSRLRWHLQRTLCPAHSSLLPRLPRTYPTALLSHRPVPPFRCRPRHPARRRRSSADRARSTRSGPSRQRLPAIPCSPETRPPGSNPPQRPRRARRRGAASLLLPSRLRPRFRPSRRLSPRREGPCLSSHPPRVRVVTSYSAAGWCR